MQGQNDTYQRHTGVLTLRFERKRLRTAQFPGGRLSAAHDRAGSPRSARSRSTGIRARRELLPAFDNLGWELMTGKGDGLHARLPPPSTIRVTKPIGAIMNGTFHSRRLLMYTRLLAGLAAATLILAPVPGSAQVTIGPGGVTIGGPQHGGGRGGGHDCAKWRHQCATEGRRCDRVQSFCGGIGRAGPRPQHFGSPRQFGGGASHAQCNQWRFECQSEGRRCGRFRDLCH